MDRGPSESGDSLEWTAVDNGTFGASSPPRHGYDLPTPRTLKDPSPESDTYGRPSLGSDRSGAPEGFLNPQPMCLLPDPPPTKRRWDLGGTRIPPIGSDPGSVPNGSYGIRGRE